MIGVAFKKFTEVLWGSDLSRGYFNIRICLKWTSKTFVNAIIFVSRSKNICSSSSKTNMHI